MLSLGYKAATEQFAPEELLDWVIEAERQGFDDITASDHFHPWRNDDVHCFSVWPWFGALGSRTQRIHFGPGITCPSFRYNPAVIAEHAATLGTMFPGRFWLGLGTGEALSERAATGCWPGYPERRARLLEAIEIIRRLWDGEHLTYRGCYFQTRDAHLYVTAQPRVRLYVGAAGRNSARLAGRHGDAWMTTGGAGSVDRLRSELIPSFTQGAREAGKDPTSMPRAVEIAVIYADSKEDGLKQARLWAATSLAEREKYGIYDPRDMQRYGELIPDKMLEGHWLISADPSEHVALAEKYIQLGFTHLFFHSPGPRQGEFIQFYGTQVLPRLRQKYGAARQAA